MPNYARDNKSKTRTEIQVRDFLGLRSSPSDLTPANALNIAKNVYFSQKGVLDTRQDITFQYIDSELGWVHNAVEFSTAAGTSYLCYPRNAKLAYYDGSNVAYATYDLDGAGINPATEDFLNTLSEVRDICASDNAAYIVDGSYHVWKFDGTTVTKHEIPNTYGKPVSICFFASRLFVITDAGYLRYTEPGIDDVWEERVLLIGTVSVTGTAVTGTGTLFNSDQLEVGTQLLFVAPGGAESYGEVASVTNNTSLTLRTTLTGTFGAGTLIYKVGGKYAEPIELSDGLVPRKIIAFGNFIAISKSSADADSPNSKLIVGDFQADPNSSVLLSRFRRVSTGYNLHPFSLSEWEDSLLFWTDRGLYALSTPPADSNNIKPTFISEGKLEDYTADLAQQKRSLTKITRIPTERKNLICITFAVDDNVSYADTMLVGYEIEPFNFEFTNFDFFTEVANDDQLSSPTRICLLINFKGDMYIISDYGLLKAFVTENGYDNIPLIISDVYLDSINLFLDSTEILLDNDGIPISYNTAVPIKKHFRFGAISNEMFNDLTISKVYLSVEERAATNAFPISFYNIKQNLDTSFNGLTIQRVYAEGVQLSTVVTMDSGIITMDSGTITMDSGLTAFAEAKKIEYFCGTRGITSVSLEIEDNYSSGRLKIWAYGVIVKPSKWSS
jgi:hypothetical protein